MTHSNSSPDIAGLVERLRLLANGGRFPAVPVVTEAAAALQSQAADITKLVEALEGLTGYGEHDDMCSVNAYSSSNPGCSCGLSEAERKARAALNSFRREQS